MPHQTRQVTPVPFSGLYILPARGYGLGLILHYRSSLVTAHQIWQSERDQARRIREGQTLRQQTAFDDYLARRAADPSYTFRRHLRASAGPSKNRIISLTAGRAPLRAATANRPAAITGHRQQQKS
jgi:hypothetical protein